MKAPAAKLNWKLQRSAYSLIFFLFLKWVGLVWDRVEADE